MWGTGKQQAQQRTGAQGSAALTVLMWDLICMSSYREWM
jgi:hypothetical protein